MIDLTKPAVYSVWSIPEAIWEAFFGGAWPSKEQCLNAGFRPLPRIDGAVYAVCLVIDRTPGKQRWEERGLLDLLEQGAEVLSGGGRPERVWDLPPAHEPNVLRGVVYRSDDENLLEAVAVDVEERPLPFDLQGSRVIERARELEQDGRGRKQRVPMALIDEGDVVEELGVRPISLFTGKANPTPSLERVRNIQRARL